MPGVVPDRINPAEDDLRVLRSDERGIVLEFSPRKLGEDGFTINGSRAILFRFDHCGFEGKTGTAHLPVRRAMVAIPPGAEVSLRIISTEFGERGDVRLLPHSRLETDEQGFDRPVYEFDRDFYRSEHFSPAQLARIERGRFRKYSIVRIFLYPLQYLPGQDLIREYQKMVVEISFRGGDKKGGIVKPIKRGAEGLYSRNLLNYGVAKDWVIKKPKKRPLGKVFQAPGPWYKLKVREEGIYQITADFLRAHGVEPSGVDLSRLQIFNNGGRELTRSPSVPRDSALVENAIYIHDPDGNDRFDNGDYILFYGKGTSGWDGESHYINRYTDENVYWLTLGGSQPKVMGSLSTPNGAGVLAGSFRSYLFREDELYHLENSGIQWYGNVFLGEDSKTYTLHLNDVPASGRADLAIKFHEGSFTVYFNDAWLGTVSSSGTFTRSGISIRDGNNTLRLCHSGGSESKAYLDWFEIAYDRHYRAVNNELLFHPPPGGTGLYRYDVAGFTDNDVFIFDVTDFDNVRVIRGTSFQDSVYSGEFKTYLAVGRSRFKTPDSMVEDAPPDMAPNGLRDPSLSADLIVIAHDDFYDAVLPLKTLREDPTRPDRLETLVVKVSDVYDEFSWGLFDPTAIRDFIKYAFYHWSGGWFEDLPTWVLLVGDGDYDYRNIESSAEKNWIPPYENRGVCSDDWFVSFWGNDLSMAIGRMPVRSEWEAEVVVGKIIQYETDSEFGIWRNTVTLVADDEKAPDNPNEHEHTRDTEYLAEDVFPESFDLKKIYLVEYPLVYTATGKRKPQAQQDLIRQINRGTLVVNFMGHGHPRQWAHETVLSASEDLPRFDNGGRLPFISAFTCSFGQFDNPHQQSMPEDLLVLEDGGMIAGLAGTRATSAGSNSGLVQRFYRRLFEENQSLGIALMEAKYLDFGGEKSYYTIFGDPSLVLARPRYQARIDSLIPDSLKALGRTQLFGKVVEDISFEGTVFVKLFDSAQPTTYVTDAGTTISYILPGNSLFRGPSAIDGGRFSSTFMVPKDISYGGNQGRISLYFWSDNRKVDGVGFRDGIYLGGTAAAPMDTIGPQIDLVLERKGFRDGDLTDEDPLLEAGISDSSGINLSGGIGHRIKLILDGDHEEDLSEYFVYDLGSYQKGKILYQMEGVSEGPHQLCLKVWDNLNNLSAAWLDFRVATTAELALEGVLNYPNPFNPRREHTTFTFSLNQSATVSIKIYTVAGRLIKTIEDVPGVDGFNYFQEGLKWDGRDEVGDPVANGVYFYKIKAVTPSRLNAEKMLKAEEIGKVMVIR